MCKAETWWLCWGLSGALTIPGDRPLSAWDPLWRRQSTYFWLDRGFRLVSTNDSLADSRRDALGAVPSCGQYCTSHSDLIEICWQSNLVIGMAFIFPLDTVQNPWTAWYENFLVYTSACFHYVRRTLSCCIRYSILLELKHCSHRRYLFDCHFLFLLPS